MKPQYFEFVLKSGQKVSTFALNMSQLSARFHIYLSTHFEIGDERSFAMWCANQPEKIKDYFYYLTEKEFNLLVEEGFKKIEDHVFPEFTNENIYS